MNHPPKPYKAYKDTGIEWLGKIPEHWEVQRVKTLFREVNLRSEDENHILLSVSQFSGVTPRKKIADSDKTDTRASTLIGYKIAFSGDMVINIMLAWNGSLGVTPVNGIVSPAYCVYRLNSGNPWYYHYLFRTNKYKAEFKRNSRGVVDSRLRLYTDDFFRLQASIPPPDEQEVIVSYLNEFESKYNHFMNNRKRLVHVLREQKQALINQAVTKGLDPTVPMKDSGIEWLGEIPEHWEVRRLKTVVRNINEQTSQKKHDEIYLAMEHVESWTGKTTPLTGEVKFDSKVKRFQIDDVLFGRLRPYLAKVTRPNKTGVCVGEFLVFRISNNSLSPKFLEYFMRSKTVIDIINKSTYGAKMPRASWLFIGSTAISLPPLDEQAAICEHIEQATATLDASIATAERELELMAEYRTRLIADVVTGKLDVRRSDRSDGSDGSDRSDRSDKRNGRNP